MINKIEYRYQITDGIVMFITCVAATLIIGMQTLDILLSVTGLW